MGSDLFWPKKKKKACGGASGPHLAERWDLNSATGRLGGYS